jgi:acyl carrier protein
MKKEDFFRKLEKELGLEKNELKESSSLHLTSLNLLSIISFIDEHFGERVKVMELMGIDSIDKLISIIGKDKFE